VSVSEATSSLDAVTRSGGFRVRGLVVTSDPDLRLLDGIHLHVRRRELVAVVGASGAGKSTMLQALLGRLPRDLEASWASATLETDDGWLDVTTLDSGGWRALRRRHVRLVSQDPAAALTPLRRVDRLMAESLRLAGHRADRSAILDVLAKAGFTEPERVVERRAHELSGGMAQRVGVALALAARPALLLADEPTTALDPDSRDAVLAALRAAADAGCAVVVVTHDLDAVGPYADRVTGLVAGRTVEPEAAMQVRVPARGPVTVGSSAPALELSDVTLGYGRRTVAERVSLRVATGEVVGLRGPSGAGKSTLLHAVVGVTTPRSGAIRVGGDDLSDLTNRELRRRVQLVPQHPREALNPWRTAEQLVREPLEIHRIGDRRGRRATAREMLGLLGLADHLDAVPLRLSTGQCQRVCLARALVTGPELLLADEPVSSLDPYLADEMLALVSEAARLHGAGVLIVSHDHGRLERTCDRVVELAAP